MDNEQNFNAEIDRLKARIFDTQVMRWATSVVR